MPLARIQVVLKMPVPAPAKSVLAILLLTALSSEGILRAREFWVGRRVRAMHGIPEGESVNLKPFGWELMSAEQLRVYWGKASTKLDNIYVDDAELGYGLRPYFEGEAALSHRGSTVYRVEYRINSHGFRDIPTPKGNRDLLLLGDSFVFGEGLGVEQTAARALKPVRGLRTLPLGVPGWATSHWLRFFELQREVPLFQGRKIAGAVLLWIPEHIERAAGRRHLKFPRYETDSAGNIQFVEVNRGDWLERGLRSCKFLSICRTAWSARQGWRGGVSQPSSGDIFREVKMVKALAEIMEKRHHARLRVMVWWPRNKVTDAFVTEARSEGLGVVTLEEALPFVAREPGAWTIPGDGHPSAEANRELAKVLAFSFGALSSRDSGAQN